MGTVMNHRTLELDKLFRSIPPEDIRQFLGPLGRDDQPTELATLNANAFEEFFRQPHTEGHRAGSFERLHCINDLADPNSAFLINTYRRFELPFNETWPLERLSMHLYL